jgi:hypothetical protein
MSSPTWRYSTRAGTDLAEHFSAAPAIPGGLANKSVPRGVRALTLATEGLTTAEIANQLNLSLVFVRS